MKRLVDVVANVATVAALAASAVLVAPAFASPETDAALAKVRALGKRWDGEVNNATKEAYLPLLKAARRDGVTVTRDVKYGPDERSEEHTSELQSRLPSRMPSSA